MVIKQRLEDQQWRDGINESSKCTLDRIRHNLNSIFFLSLCKRKIFCKFRPCNHKLPIEVEHYTNPARINRINVFFVITTHFVMNFILF